MKRIRGFAGMIWFAAFGLVSVNRASAQDALAQDALAQDALAQRGSAPTGRIDSVVLEVGDGHRRATTRLALRRRGVASGALEQLVREAESIGFFRLPMVLWREARFCPRVRSDALPVTLTFFHANGTHAVHDYRHCDPPSPALDSLFRLEEHVRRRAARPMTRSRLGVQSDPCPLGRTSPRFDSQTDHPAVLISRTYSMPVPDPTLRDDPPYAPDFALAQFVVDTSGRPVVGTLKMLAQPAGLARDVVLRALPTWRFTAARSRGCTVAQLVQMPIRWR